MIESLLVWGLRPSITREQVLALVDPGAAEVSALQVEGEVAWAALSVADSSAAVACLASLAGYGLEVRLELRTLSASSAAQAQQHLRRLAAQLDCCSWPLPGHLSVWVTRGAAAVCDAICKAGGATAWYKIDGPAAARIAFALLAGVYDDRKTWLPPGTCKRVVDAFKPLMPQLLSAAASGLLLGEASAAEHARLASLMLCSLRTDSGYFEQAATTEQAPALLDAIVEAMPSVLQGVKSVQREVLRQQPAPLTGSEPDQQSELLMPQQDAVIRRCIMLLEAAVWLLRCMTARPPSDFFSARRLMATLEQFVRQVVPAAAVNASTGMCLKEIYSTLQTTCDAIAAAEPGVVLPQLYPVALKALRTLLDRGVQPHQAGELLGLSLLAMPDDDSPTVFCTTMAQLARAQALAAEWLGLKAGTPAAEETGPMPQFDGITTLADQAALLFDCTTAQLATLVKAVIDGCDSDPMMVDHRLQLIVQSNVIPGLAMALKAASVYDCRSVRMWCHSLRLPYERAAVMPGIYEAARALQTAAEFAGSAAAVGKPFPADVLADLVSGGIGCQAAAEAESAACRAARSTHGRFVVPGFITELGLRRTGANIMQLVSQVLPPRAARSLGNRGLVTELSQALPWAPTKQDMDNHDPAAVPDAVIGMNAVLDCLHAICSAGPRSHTFTVHTGDIAAAVQRVEEFMMRLSPSDPAVHRGIAAVLHKLQAIVSLAKHDVKVPAGGSQATTDAEAVAAAERAMQELLVAEGAADATAGSSSPSKAAAKRARKKAARKAAAAQDAAPSSAEDATPPSGGSTNAAVPASRADATGEQSSSSHISALPAVAAAAAQGDDADQLSHTDAATQNQPAAGSAASDRRDSGGMATVQPGAEPAGALPEWCRCALTGQRMRDPVLCGAEGHSFERAVVEAWLDAHPGVAPLTLQPLPSSQLKVIPNHALRQLIQQLGISATG